MGVFTRLDAYFVNQHLAHVKCMREWCHEFVCTWVFVFHQFAVSFVRMCFIHSMSCSIEKVSNAAVIVSVCFPLQFLEFSMTTFYKKRRGLQLKVQLLSSVQSFFQYFGGSDGSCPDWLAADRDPRANTRNSGWL